jgi:hypothetical protein
LRTTSGVDRDFAAFMVERAFKTSTYGVGEARDEGSRGEGGGLADEDAREAAKPFTAGDIGRGGSWLGSGGGASAVRTDQMELRLLRVVVGVFGAESFLLLAKKAGGDFMEKPERVRSLKPTPAGGGTRGLCECEPWGAVLGLSWC